MKISFVNLRKYRMTTPFWVWPRVERYWSGKIIYIILTRDHSISLDFRKDILNDMIPEKERESFWRRVALRLNLLNRHN